jgi:dipeptidase E
MRLYLSSLGLGDATSELLALAPRGRVALIMNALDGDASSRGHWQADQSRELAALGYHVEDLDLRRFFGEPEALRAALAPVGMVWINGGNTFVLMRAMRLSGFDRIIKERLAEDTIVYGGFSAATVAATPSLRGIEAMDDPNEAPESYPSEIVWDGLGLVPFQVAVHYRSDHPESDDVEEEIAFYEREGLAYRTLRDGQVLVVRDAVDGGELIG